MEQDGPGGTTRILVDTSPDLRAQLLQANVGEIDAVVYTHDHADHTHGVDDLRVLALRMGRRVPVHMDDDVWRTMHARFGYCFETPPGSSYPPILDARAMTTWATLSLTGAGGDVEVQPIPVNHGDIDALSLRFGNMAYMPDVKDISSAAEAALQDLDILVIDALRDTPHPSHFSVSDALRWIERLSPRRAILTNLHIDLDYDGLSARMPDHVSVAHDGLTFTPI